MTRVTFPAKKMADIEAVLPGFKKIWPKIKEMTGTTQRCPKNITFTDKSSPVYLNDGQCGVRFSLDLINMEISPEVYSISSGEWACHGGSNHDKPVTGVPEGKALMTITWHDYYRTFSVEVQVNKIPEQIGK